MSNLVERGGIVKGKTGLTLKVYTTQIGVGPIVYEVDTHKSCILEMDDQVQLVGEKSDFRECRQLGIYAMACFYQCPVRAKCKSFRDNVF